MNMYLNSSLDEILLHCKVTSSVKFAGTHLYTWVLTGTVKDKCLSQEHNRAVTPTAKSVLHNFQWKSPTGEVTINMYMCRFLLITGVTHLVH